eukprot:gene30670-37921_t
MILGLRQPGHGDGANNAHAPDDDGKRAAVRRVVLAVEVGNRLEIHPAQLVVAAHMERTAAEAAYHVVLAPYPVGLVGAGAVHGVVEQHLAVARDVHGSTPAPAPCHC